MQRLTDQRGVAMVTVLLIAASLTAVASAAAFGTIRELRSTTQDRRSAQALAFAEAGVDRMLNYLRGGQVNWADIALAGCPAAGRYTGETNHPPLTLPSGTQGQVGAGSYTVKLEVFNPVTTTLANRFAPGACNDPAFPRHWQSPKLPGGFWSGASQYFAIIATGASATSASPCPQLTGGACRTVRQVLRIKGIGLPVGVYAKTSIDLNGTPDMTSISVLTPGSVTGREKAGFSGLDKYYYLGDFDGWGSMANASTTPAPAGVHAGGSISLRSIITANSLEHPTSQFVSGNTTYLNCTANDLRGTDGQSQWDQSGPGYGGTTSGSCSWAPPSGGPPNVPPPTSLITNFSGVAPTPDLTAEDYAALKATAQNEGIYCSFGPQSCRKNGADWPGFAGTVQAGDLTGLKNIFIAYFEYPSLATGNIVRWRAGWGPCTDNPATMKQVIIIVRRGHLDMSGGGAIHGAAIVPEGDVDESGGVQFEGTIIANRFRNRGNSSFLMTDCSLRNLPAAWLDFTPFSWTEVDR